ncbi:MAG: DGQHR domain-containing protein [Candidatus Heimdallarchaeaceae archaeon]
MKKIEIKSLKIKQKDKDMYIAGMKVSEIRTLFYVFRKSKDNPEALERQLVKRKVKDINDRANQRDIYFPNAIIVNIIDFKRVEVVEKENDSNSVTLKISLPEGGTNEVLESKEGKIGYIIDGQHRIEGLQNYPDFTLPVVMFNNVNKDIAYKTFAEINRNQEKVKNLLLNYIRWEIEDYGADDTSPRAFEIVMDLNTHEDSPLKDNIRIFEDEKKKWINQPTLQKLVNKVISEDGPIFSWNKAQQTDVIKNYLNAWKRVYPDAWNKQTREKYVLTKAMGITIIFHLFERFFNRCSLYENNHSIEAFENQIKLLKDVEILIGTEAISLDWDRERFGKMSSGKGIRALTRHILRSIPQSGPPE